MFDPEKHHRRSIRLQDYDYSQNGAYFVTICAYKGRGGIISAPFSIPAQTGISHLSSDPEKCKRVGAEIYTHPYIFMDIVDGEIMLNEFGKIVESAWADLPKHYFNIELDESIIMPNHIHGIIFIVGVGAGFKPAPTDGVKQYPLSEIVRGFKTFSARRINEMRGASSVSVWQRNYYEHIIRNEYELNRTREYIINNFLQWQLDRENPERSPDPKYENQWKWLES
jgi:REP element-mobilizing transposase RayT